MHLGWQFTTVEQNPTLAAADVVLVLDSDVPYIESNNKPSDDATLYVIDNDPIKAGMSLWHVPARRSAAANSKVAVAQLAGADTCVAPVLSIAEVAASPQFVARGVVGEAVHPTEGAVAQLAPLLAGMARPAEGEPVMLPDMTRTDTEHLLNEAGVDGETVARWVARQVVA